MNKKSLYKLVFIFLAMTVLLSVGSCALAQDMGYADDGKVINGPTAKPAEPAKTPVDPCANGHTNRIVAGYPATCTSSGMTDGIVCAVCGKVISAQEFVPVQDHKAKTVRGYAATCTQDGRTNGSVCAYCGKVLERQRTIPALDHKWGNPIILKMPTCTEDGIKEYLCVRCFSEGPRDSIPAAGHDWGISYVIQEPTCTVEGIREYQCTVCHTEGPRESIPALEHQWDISYIIQEPTCTEEGVREYQCSRCKTEGPREAIAALGHDWGEWEITYNIENCEQGYRHRECKRCGASEGSDVFGKEHVWGEWTQYSGGTCVALEQLARSCTVCATLEIKDGTAYGPHDWDDGKVIKKPTFTQAGKRLYTCKNDSSHTKTVLIPASGLSGSGRPSRPRQLYISEQPKSGKAGAGAFHTLTVKAENGVPPYAYQWYVIPASPMKNSQLTELPWRTKALTSDVLSTLCDSLYNTVGRNLSQMLGTPSNAQAIPGATDAVYEADSPGIYFCVVRDSKGKAVQSDTATVAAAE